MLQQGTSSKNKAEDLFYRGKLRGWLFFCLRKTRVKQIDLHKYPEVINSSLLKVSVGQK